MDAYKSSYTFSVRRKSLIISLFIFILWNSHYIFYLSQMEKITLLMGEDIRKDTP